MSDHVETRFQLRQQDLQARVAEAAKALHERGIRPTVARVRSALGGGSPNDLAPALKLWRESALLSASNPSLGEAAATAQPLHLGDLVHELWQRETAAAIVEVRGGASAREVAARAGEAQVLRDQVESLRDQLQRESLAYGELRAQAARHESIARAALARAEASDSRERDLLRELGGLRQRISELEAQLEQRPMSERPFASRRPRLAPGARPRKTKQGRVRLRRKAPKEQMADKKRSRLRRSRGRRSRGAE